MASSGIDFAEEVTLAQLRSSLAPHGSRTFAIEVDGRSLRPGFRVTEVRQAALRALDCGRREDCWTEVVVELMEGPHISGRPMEARRFLGIVDAGTRDADDAVPVFEFGETGLVRYRIAGLRADADGPRLVLAPMVARCKAAERATCCA
ncbi:MAG: DUF6428 family protein [Jannaschia sp.]